MTKFRILISSAAMVMLVYASGCKANNEQASQPTPKQSVKIQGDGQQAAPAQMPPQQPGIEGKVLETMDASGYTYVQVETATGPVWAAMPQSKVDVGQDIALSGGMPMTNFESKTLGRTFDTIIFSGGVVKQGASATAPAATDSSLPPVGGCPDGHPLPPARKIQHLAGGAGGISSGGSPPPGIG